MTFPLQHSYEQNQPREDGPHLRALVDSAASALWAIDSTGVFTFVEGGGLERLGLHADVLVGRSIFEVYADVPAVLGDAKRALAGERFTSVTAHSGGVFETRYAPLRGDGGALLGVMGVVVDVTHRTQVLEELRHRERLREHTRRLAKLGSWRWDIETNTVELSTELALIYAAEPDTPVARFEDYLARVHPEDRPVVLDRLQRALQALGPFEFAARIVRPSGETRILRTQGEVVRDHAGRPRCVLAASHDITEQVAAEEALRNAQASYRAIFDLSRDAIFVHDLETGVVVDANLRGYELCGVEPGDLAALEALRMEGEAPQRTDSMALAAAGEPQRFEVPVDRPGSGVHWAEVSLRRVEINGTDRVLSTVRDISERKEAEAVLLRSNDELERLVVDRTSELAATNLILQAEIAERERAEGELQKAKDDAEKANLAKSEFLSRMSHELRTPMNSILGFGQLLERKELPADQRRGVEHILKAGRHLLNLINEVLEISRIEAGRQDLSMEPVHLATVLTEAHSLIQPLASQREISMEPSPVDAEVYVRADRQRLVQVLLNLLSNGVKYNRPQGRVTVTCAGGVQADGANVQRIGIRDTGPGIPAEKLDRLFIPFERLGAEQSQIEGTGLGLALSMRLVEAMGGTLSVESTVDEGSTFWIELPRVDAPGRPGEKRDRAATAAVVPVDAPPAMVLYIEDNLPNLTLIESILSDRPNLSLLTTTRGGLGVSLAAEHRPDLVLLDLHLPDMRGDEVLRRLQDDPRTRDTPVVIVSADATASTVERLASAGAAGYLTKPLDVEEFLATIDRVLGRARS